MEGRSGEGIEIEMQIGKGKENLSEGSEGDTSWKEWEYLGDIMYIMYRIKMFAPRGDRREFNLPRNKLIDAW